MYNSSYSFNMLFFILQCMLALPSVTANSNYNHYNELRSNWYTRYSKYPEYCSTDEQMNKRKIPPLSTNSQIETKLIHVTAIIRHGARTPWNNHTCWTGWEEQSWNCELKTLTSPPSQPEILKLEKEGEGNAQLDGEGAMFLFEKNYDALNDPPQLRNMLNGTCQKGQLLLRGYVQETNNGKILRNAYVREKDVDYASDEMVLFDLNHESDARPYQDSLYYRSDDDQRTIMSGSVLLRGLFGDLIQQHSEELGTQVDPTIVVHTADRMMDVLSPNSMICPRLNDLNDEARNSEEYKKRFVESKESKELDKLMEDELGGNFRMPALDCLMTSICNDRDLPDILNDYGEDDGKNYFDRLSRYSYQPYNYVMRYNDGAFSKLAFGPMWVNILSNMLQFIPKHVWGGILPQMENEVGSGKAPKLSLFSAHDTTVLPILATLGEEVWDGEEWAPYASMIVIEVHNIKTKNNVIPDYKAFRLIYNGSVLTEKVEGCAKGQELCDIRFLLMRVAPFAVNTRDCESQNSNLNLGRMKDVFDTKEGVAAILFTSILSGILGGLMTFIFLKRNSWSLDGRGTFDKAPENEKESALATSYGAANSPQRKTTPMLDEKEII